MTAAEYIKQQLEELKEINPKKIAKEDLPDEIFRIVMSKKFRKYSAKPMLAEHIRRAIKLNVEKNQPIRLVFPHGAYKLWRLEEAPLPDWGELFTAMYYTKWLKPICEIYSPGVVFDYFVDDLIVPKIDNISLEKVDLYREEYQKVLDFLKYHQPSNFRMTITPFKILFKSVEDFETSLEEYVNKFASTNPKFTKEQLQSVYLNTKPTPEQLKDPGWKEKTRLIHDAYIMLKRDTGYLSAENKIPVFNQPLPSGMYLAVGTTKASIAKFWVGIGALRKTESGYQEYILSPKQIETHELMKENVSIKGLSGKNFQSINIFS